MAMHERIGMLAYVGVNVVIVMNIYWGHAAIGVRFFPKGNRLGLSS